MSRVVVVGGGAAGLFAAYASIKKGNLVTLIEKNEKLGKKLYITGKGRCNLTNNVPVSEFFANVVTNPKFVYSAVNTLSPQNTQEIFQNLGLKLKVERGNRVFPLSDKASDVTKTLENFIKKEKVKIILNTEVYRLVLKDNSVLGVETSNGIIYCDSVIVCTGGMSYPLTGSDGDGYSFAKSVGHTIITPKPALVGIELKNPDFMSLQGVSLKNVALKATLGDKVVYSDFGEMLFTHFGVSGPIILSCSSVINKHDVSNLKLVFDLKPAVSYDALNSRFLKEFKENNSKKIHSVMRSFLPKALIDIILKRASVSINKNCSEITQVERDRLIKSLKNLDFQVKGLRPIDEAIVTSGGICVKEINPKTMESKIIKNLYFAGEVLDIDAFTGGFNLQLAFSTGYVAGTNA